MFRKEVLRVVACIVLVAYVSVYQASTVAAAESRLLPAPQFFLAQAAEGTVTADMAPGEKSVLRQIYLDKILRFEAEINSARGAREGIMTMAVSSLFVGVGLMVGSGNLKSTVEDIEIQEGPEHDRERKDKEQALNALETVQTVGAGVLGIGGACLLGYMLYSAGISAKQKKITALRTELDALYETQGLTPEYVQKNPSLAAAMEEMDVLKKKAASGRTFQSIFSRLAIGSIISGGFLASIAAPLHDVIEDIEIDDEEEIRYQEDALDAADNLQTTGLVLLGAGGACAITSMIFGMRARKKEQQIEKLEDGMLRVMDRVDIRPTLDGFRVMYTYRFK